MFSSSVFDLKKKSLKFGQNCVYQIFTRLILIPPDHSGCSFAAIMGLNPAANMDVCSCVVSVAVSVTESYRMSLFNCV